MSVGRGDDALWSRVSERISEVMGLHFPPPRLGDLQRGLAGAAEACGCTDAVECAEWVLAAELNKEQQQILARYLTIGETYFFREKVTLAALEEKVLPELIGTRRRLQVRHLRIWSAACATGEEAYTLAILLERVLPDLGDWHVKILATDINTSFLQKAAAGEYGEWSFRDAPEWLKNRCFERTAGGRYAIRPEIRRRVTFAQLNLVGDHFPSLATDTNGFDLILCRNVLMYFTQPQARKVVDKLRRALVEDGWLAVSANEGTHRLFTEFGHGGIPGAQVYRKHAAAEVRPVFSPLPERLFETDVRLPLPAEDPIAVPQVHETFSREARRLANEGRLKEALDCCERWVGVDKLDASAHYLRAVVLQELGNLAGAREALTKAIFLEPNLILGHFALGNLSRAEGRPAEAARHFENALRLLQREAPETELAETEGLTVGRLSEIIQSLRTIPA